MNIDSFEIPSDLHLAPQPTGAVRSFVEWVGKGWNSVDHKDTLDSTSNYRRGIGMILLGAGSTVALMTIPSCSNDSQPSTTVKPNVTTVPHCVFSTDSDPTATTVYTVQPNDGRDSILYKIPGVNPDQCAISAMEVVNNLNQGTGFKLETPRVGQEVKLPQSAEFVEG